MAASSGRGRCGSHSGHGSYSRGGVAGGIEVGGLWGFQRKSGSVGDVKFEFFVFFWPI